MSAGCQVPRLTSAMLALTLSAGTSASPPESAVLHGAGPVKVMYAGSLTGVFEGKVGPAFSDATGFTFEGEGKGSVAIANLIKGKVRAPDVFVSADPTVNASLQGPANGDFVSWWVPFARTEMVVAWSPKSRFRPAFEAAAEGKRSWESVLQEPELRLGRSDPELDPKGYRALWLFRLDEDRTGDRGLAQRILGAPDSAAQIFPEEQLVARLQAGQIDAGILYLIEALEARLPHLRLPAAINQGDPGHASHYARMTYTTRKGATFTGAPILYTATIPSTVRRREGAEAFVQFLLSRAGRDLLSKEGLLRVAPVVAGNPGAVSSSLQPYVEAP